MRSSCECGWVLGVTECVHMLCSTVCTCSHVHWSMYACVCVSVLPALECVHVCVCLHVWVCTRGLSKTWCVHFQVGSILTAHWDVCCIRAVTRPLSCEPTLSSS